MTLRIQNASFWDLSKDFLLDSRFRFEPRQQVTKFVYLPDEEVLVLGTGKETPSHKALMSAFLKRDQTDTSRWVRAVVLRGRKIVYYRQGVLNLEWYDRTTEMLRRNGLPATYKVAWGPQAKKELAGDLAGFP